jgi:hypothetical protein
VASHTSAISSNAECFSPAGKLWAIIIRSKGEYLGSVEAPDRERAEAVAIKQFELDQDQRRRLLIRERL